MKSVFNKSLPMIMKIVGLFSYLFSIDCFAANDFNALDTSLSEMSDSMGHLISGHIGKIIALLALVWAIIGSIFKFNVMLVLTLFGVLLMLAFGVTMIDSLF
jgi:hypothetical protein